MPSFTRGNVVVVRGTSVVGGADEVDPQATADVSPRATSSPVVTRERLDIEVRLEGGLVSRSMGRSDCGMTSFAADTELVYLRDVDLRSFEAVVVGIDGDSVALDRTAFYPTGGGQPHDIGTLAGSSVVNVRKGPSPDGSYGWVWHVLDGALPSVGDTVTGEVDDDRRFALMRTHTAMHVLCGVIWNEWKVPVTGGNMEPLSGRMDFEFDPVPEGFAARIEELVNAEIAADRPVRVEFLPRDTAVQDADLIRTKVSLIPESVQEIRVVDIVGLDKQADGGTHVHSTKDVGRVKVLKVENKGKGNKRVRIEIVDA